MVGALVLLACLAACKGSGPQGQFTARDLGKAIATGEKVAKAIDSLVQELTAEQEYWVGRSIATNILARNGYRYLDKEAIRRGELAGLTAYVGQVGGLLGAAALGLLRDGDRPAPLAGWHFVVVDSNEINAFAAPGGFIFITSAAVKAAKSEDELACVLAHEVAHVVRGHALGNIQKSRYANVSSDLLHAAGSATLTPAQLNQLTQLMDGMINDTLEALFVKGYSRDTEFEADALGVQIAGAAGYDPAAMNRFLATLAAKQDTGKGGFFATHPKAAERIARIDDELRGMPPTKVPPARVDRFAAAVAKIK